MSKKREPRLSWLELKGLLRSPIAFHRIFATVGGGAMPGLFLSQAFYWSGITEDVDGWFYKSAKEWEAETGLTRTEQMTARNKLQKRDLIEVDLRGVPATLHYRLKEEPLLLAIEDTLDTQFAGNVQTEIAENLQTRKQETRKLVRGKRANKVAGKRQTLGTENKAEIKKDLKTNGNFNKSSNGKPTKPDIEKAAMLAYTQMTDAARRRYIEEQAQFQNRTIAEIMWQYEDYEVMKVVKQKT